MFRLWKSFYIWQKWIRYRKFTNARNYMQKNLFVCNPTLGKTLLKIKAMNTTFLESSLVDISVVEKLSLFEFVELQVLSKFIKFHQIFEIK